MVIIEDSIIQVIKRYIDKLDDNGIKISGAIVFGSYAKGVVHDNSSDIDVALISDAFTGNRYDDRRMIVPLRRQIDNRIEPIPFKPEDFNKGSMLIDEIKNTGKKIL